MKTVFKINFVNNHLLIQDGDATILVDTGSPITIHVDQELQFAGETYQVTTNALGNTIEKLKSLSKLEFTTLMGLDILSKYKVIIDYKNSEISFFTKDELNPNGDICTFKMMMGAIIIPIEINGKTCDMILDTGATLSYIDISMTKGLISRETITDFSPLVGGQFSTPVFEIESSFNGVPFNCRYGNLPSTIALMMKMIGVWGVIGYDFLNSFKIMIDISDSKMIFIR